MGGLERALRPGEDYAVLFYETARMVKSLQPGAKVRCTACGLNGVRAVIARLRRENAFGLGETFINHPYDRKGTALPEPPMLACDEGERGRWIKKSGRNRRSM
jgi:hypothetical protein